MGTPLCYLLFEINPRNIGKRRRTWHLVTFCKSSWHLVLDLVKILKVKRFCFLIIFLKHYMEIYGMFNSFLVF